MGDTVIEAKPRAGDPTNSAPEFDPIYEQKQPHRPPHKPNMYELQDHGRRFPPNHLHESWLDYLYWDIELEA